MSLWKLRRNRLYIRRSGYIHISTLYHNSDTSKKENNINDDKKRKEVIKMLKIYVANLGKYNEGRLVGKWLTLPASEAELEKLYVDIKVAHYDESGEYIPYYEENGIMYEEVAIHDYETDITDLKINEYEDIDALNELAKEIETLDEYDRYILNAIIDARGEDLKSALDHIGEATFYPGYTLEQVAEELVDDGCFGEIPESIACYIDYEAIARDLSMDNYYEVSNGVICI